MAQKAVSCSDLCSQLSFTSSSPVTPILCQAYDAGSTIEITGGQATAQCGSTIEPEIDVCRVTLSVKTSDSSETYMEVWLPNDAAQSWNGRTLSTDNGGLSGCVAYKQLQYVSGRGFAAIGDNGGHNSSSFDGAWVENNHEWVLDWVYRARHESVQAGKDVVSQFYGRAAHHSYYLGCSTGGQQGLHAAQYYPDDFDGIIAGSPSSDFNHLQGWSGRFVTLTGTSADDPRFLTEDEWIYVQSAIFAQCDEALDGVDDGILEDPTICRFNSSVLSCENNGNQSGCLTKTQTTTVDNVFSNLSDEDGQVLYPALLYGSQVDAFRLGQLSGSVQGISRDWFRYGVLNDSTWDPLEMNVTDVIKAQSLDSFNGHVSSYSGDLSGFRRAGKKLLLYHGMADPLVSGGNSQRYYLKVARQLGLSHTDLDEFFRYFRISGMAHCGVGGISGAGPWMFGQTQAADLPGTVENVIDTMVRWVEGNEAPETLTGTKFWWDEESLGLQSIRAHCRFPYRTTYVGGDAADADSWNCTLIDDWQSCGPDSLPHLCNSQDEFAA